MYQSHEKTISTNKTLEKPAQYAFTDNDINLANTARNNRDTLEYLKSGAEPNQRITGIIERPNHTIIELPAVSNNQASPISISIKPQMEHFNAINQARALEEKDELKYPIKILAPYKLDAWHWNVLEIVIQQNSPEIECRRYNTDGQSYPVEDNVFKDIKKVFEEMRGDDALKDLAFLSHDIKNQKDEKPEYIQEAQGEEPEYIQGIQRGVNCGLGAGAIMHDLKYGDRRTYDGLEKILKNGKDLNIQDIELREEVEELVSKNLAPAQAKNFCKLIDESQFIAKLSNANVLTEEGKQVFTQLTSLSLSDEDKKAIKVAFQGENSKGEFDDLRLKLKEDNLDLYQALFREDESIKDHNAVQYFLSISDISDNLFKDKESTNNELSNAIQSFLQETWVDKTEREGLIEFAWALIDSIDDGPSRDKFSEIATDIILQKYPSKDDTPEKMEEEVDTLSTPKLERRDTQDIFLNNDLLRTNSLSIDPKDGTENPMRPNTVNYSEGSYEQGKHIDAMKIAVFSQEGARNFSKDFHPKAKFEKHYWAVHEKNSSVHENEKQKYEKNYKPKYEKSWKETLLKNTNIQGTKYSTQSETLNALFENKEPPTVIAVVEGRRENLAPKVEINTGKKTRTYLLADATYDGTNVNQTMNFYIREDMKKGVKIDFVDIGAENKHGEPDSFKVGQISFKTKNNNEYSMLVTHIPNEFIGDTIDPKTNNSIDTNTHNSLIKYAQEQTDRIIVGYTGDTNYSKQIGAYTLPSVGGNAGDLYFTPPTSSQFGDTKKSKRSYFMQTVPLKKTDDSYSVSQSLMLNLVRAEYDKGAKKWSKEAAYTTDTDHPSLMTYIPLSAELDTKCYPNACMKSDEKRILMSPKEERFNKRRSDHDLTKDEDLKKYITTDPSKRVKFNEELLLKQKRERQEEMKDILMKGRTTMRKNDTTMVIEQDKEEAGENSFTS